ncbi:hypothetical protein LX88_004599 [Lentzea californiensis]|nr:hypothetical protein [Lentzea californiensis]
MSAGHPWIGISWPVPEGSASWAEPVVMVFDDKTYEYLGTKNRPQDASGFVDRVATAGSPLAVLRQPVVMFTTGCRKTLEDS